ncbi:glycoside hydrolase family 2 protein [Flavilitoribacter nigricans]|uniref:Glycoside hydrolase family 2 n=1 Tax=Flavilitoribacter nigricans (strain ATCC 23147 / DSM 23189 / NBRC 102662 / NCIMB 1420 / SS-2) TaxID=1122177 RepID=A0A2D0NES4_FLAN2|nr:sugar-binding domain-containing protein [Flavilitoribacter nigricans]PHN06283.1 glycoside hydrolase family 2 [Flavilitoribacter nigricans DSM 23189 = NBRC 102662]
MNSTYPPALLWAFLFLPITIFSQTDIPLPEHPRPDFERADWQNLNGTWDFAFDPEDTGLSSGWEKGDRNFSKKILVPFPWGSKLSGLEDEADIGWYQKEITVPAGWRNKRTFLTIGASDWETHVWLDGQLLGSHRGGYVPFSFELTELLKYGTAQKLVIRVDDKRRDFTLYGKQGYGNARGIWQTIYLEARGTDYLDAVHVLPDIDKNTATVTAYLPETSTRDLELQLEIPNAEPAISQKVTIPAGEFKYSVEIPMPNAHRWSLEDPFLYDLEATLGSDQVSTYFGMRKVSVMNMPGTEYPYIALNNEPIYVQLALDQSYHPEGFYTFPSDQFMKEEIERSKSIGLNGIRVHIKVEVPRKLYWADKLGLLVMADLPNSWGEPDEKMQAASEYTLREMIERDYNHPSIFSWIVFNETWGLRTEVKEGDKMVKKYLPTTQNWVASMYYLAKSLDPTRLVEDNSICYGAGHTETDINSWHAYLPGWEWDEHLKNISDNTYAGSDFDFEDGFQQGKQPNINSECGNVWGYDGSTGDVDWSWDYHRMMNTFRIFPKIAGWLYTEHHDVINEWNGYWRFDRTEKETGLGDMVEGMSLNDLHAPLYISTGNEICLTAKGGSEVKVPLYISAMTGDALGPLELHYELHTTNYIGETEKNHAGTLKIDYQPWMQEKLTELSVPLPDVAGTGNLKLVLKDQSGKTLHRNFMLFEIESDQELEKTDVVSIAPNAFSRSDWSKKQWEVLDGLKVNGAGKGYFEYELEIPDDVKVNRSKQSYLLFELSAKQQFVKDMEEFDNDQDYMLGSRVAPSSNPNAYPMTDETATPSTVSITVDGTKMMTAILPDDPADHRGFLSWHHQPQDRKIREGGSYGYLIKVPVNKRMLRQAAKDGKLIVRIAAEDNGGVAIYGKSFGQYAVDPSLVLKY